MMKRILYLFFLLSSTVITMQAQELPKFSYALTLGTGISMNTPSSMPFEIQGLGYYNLSGRWSVGGGVGVSFYEKMLIPLFGDVKYQIGRTRQFTPYVEAGIGYSFAPSTDANGGLFINPSVGVQYRVKDRIKLQLAIGYELQELERLKKHNDDYFHKEFAEQLGHHLISFKLGLLF